MTDASDTALQDELFEVEQGFWLSGEEHFRSHVDEQCLLAFPQAGEMHGVHGREAVAASVSTQPGRWRDLAISSRHMVQPTDEVAIISYRADVKRFDGEPYAALVSSVYVKRGDGWKLAFHQHSVI